MNKVKERVARAICVVLVLAASLLDTGSAFAIPFRNGGGGGGGGVVRPPIRGGLRDQWRGGREVIKNYQPNEYRGLRRQPVNNGNRRISCHPYRGVTPC